MRQASKLAGSARELDRARIDQSVAVLLCVVTQLQVWLSGSVHDRPQAAVAGLVLCGAVAVRRRWPLGALLAGCGAVSIEAAFGGALVDSVSVSLVAGVLCFYGAGAFLPSLPSGFALAAGVVVLLPQIVLTRHVVSNLFFEPAILAFVPWLCGRWMRDGATQARRLRELSEQLDAERERRVDAAADLERIRIARELHDVIGHCLSVIVLQAGGARMVVSSQPNRAREAMRIVERAGYEALGEVRHLLGVFGENDAADGLHPQPGIGSIADLVTRTRAAGLETELMVDGQPRELSPGLSLCAYRIVQEGLTNTIKHARAARAVVRVSWKGDQLALEVADDGCGSPDAAHPHLGHGIVGMRERAALHHGSVQVGSSKGGGYRVQASFPLAGPDDR